MRNIEMSLYEYLKEIRLEKFEQGLREQDVSFVSDLTKITKTTLISEVGMTPIQAKRIVRTMGEMFPDLVSIGRHCSVYVHSSFDCNCNCNL